MKEILDLLQQYNEKMRLLKDLQQKVSQIEKLKLKIYEDRDKILKYLNDHDLVQRGNYGWESRTIAFLSQLTEGEFNELQSVSN
jgi:hypothetical protein